MSELSPETHQLLDLARGASVLTDERRSRIRAGLFTQIAAGGLAATVAGSAGVGKAAWLSGTLAKVVSGVALVSVTGAGMYVATRPAKTQAPAEHSVSASNAPVPVAHAAPKAAPAVVQAPTADTSGSAVNDVATSAAAPSSAPGVKSSGFAARAVTPAFSAAPALNADTLSEETRLLRDADQALRAGNAQRALTLLDAHAAQFPHGVLAPERGAERMIARCQLGQVDAASASAYLSAHPASPFTARIRDACNTAR